MEKIEIKPLVEENGQTLIDFNAPELIRFLSDLNTMYPIIKEVIKDRITYDGENFILNNKKYSEEELKVLMKKLNDLKIEEQRKKDEDEDGGYEYDWQGIFNK